MYIIRRPNRADGSKAVLLSRADLSYRSLAPLATYEGWRRCNRSPSQRWVDRSPSTRL